MKDGPGETRCPPDRGRKKMAKFLFLFRGEGCQPERSPEEMQQVMQGLG